MSRNAGKVQRAAVVVIGLLIAGCGSGQGIEGEKKLVDRFHTELDQQQYARIYAECDRRFRARVPEAQYVRLLTVIHKKLGNVRGETLDGVTTTVNAQGTFIILRYTTRFERGTAAETFNWQLDGDSAKLAGYFIKRDAPVKI